MPRLWILIPALDEEASIGKVLDDIPTEIEGIDGNPRCIVIDNGSRDRTAEIAAARGAEIVREDRRGYGQACLSGISRLQEMGVQDEDLVLFLDADASDDPSDLPAVLEPLLRERAQLVIGSRVLGSREAGSLTPQQVFGNWLATLLIRWITGVRFTDLGPFRALRHATLRDLDMRDRAFGWTVEMQLKAASRGLRCFEVPVRYRRRIGRSKISGTLRGSVLAGTTILGILFLWMLRRPGMRTQ